jgi:transcriptional regulator with XRE-family HTH domain
MPHITTMCFMAKRSALAQGSPVLRALGSAIRDLRIQSGHSQEELAGLAGIDRSYMGGLERGEHNVALVNIHRIARALDISIAQIMKAAGV